MSPLILKFIFTLGVTTVAYAFGHTFTLAAQNISPDGVQRSAALVNGRFPGPILAAFKGQPLSVNVVNNLDDPTMRQSTSIHWHGIFQPHNSQNDGPSFVTQCPIAPGQSYQYQINTGKQTGTFWYHSHLGTQYVDGVRGPLIIYDFEDPQQYLYDVDDFSTVITLADWYHNKAEAILAAIKNNGTLPIPDSGLINGIGTFVGGPNVTLARINVFKGLRYRFRVIGLSAFGFFDFAIQNHSLTVIEADGVAHQPLTVDAVNIGPGQRYSVVVHANQAVGNYWIRATETVIGFTSFPTNPNFNGNLSNAVLHYYGAPSADPPGPPPTTLPPGGVELQEFNLQPLINPGSPGGENPPNLQVFNFSFSIGSPTGSIWTVNGVPYQSPTVPTLLNILANGGNAQFASSENTFTLPPNVTVEINFAGAIPLVAAGHPFHLHGHTFDVIQSAEGPVNFVNPPRRDTVKSAATPIRVRFTTDNPGPWFVHCHIDWHLATGLAVVFAEDPAGIVNGTAASHPDSQFQQLCSIYNSLPASQQ